MNRYARLSVSLVLLAQTAAAAPSATERPLRVDDLLTLARISDPRVSPDGERVAFVVRETDLEANRGRTDLWLAAVDGSSVRRLTTDPANDSSPRFSPAGEHLYFLSSRSGSSQVWRLPLAGGEARQVTALGLDVGTLAVSPAGRRLAVTLEVFPDCPTLACSVERLEEKESSAASGRLYERLFVRHWDSWKDGRRSQLYTLELDEQGGARGAPVAISRPLDADVPTKPFGGGEEIAFTPDGETLVFTARVAGESEPWSTDLDLYRAPADGSAPPVVLTAANPAIDTQPVFSPDGRTLAYLATERPGYESDRRRIVLRSWPHGGERVLAADWDRSVIELVFSPDGATLYATAADRGRRSLFAVDVASGDVRRLLADGTVVSPAVAGQRLVFGRDHLRSPVELYSIALPSGGSLQAITDINGERLAGVAMGEPRQLTFAGWNGETVHAWLVEPAGFDAADSGRRYPLAVLVHGGPHGSFGDRFLYSWNTQIYAGAGYAVLMIDFHGSIGYGQAFTDSIRGDWGGKPLADIQRGLAAVSERYPWIAGDRACALGASYGGYMINWIAGAWLDAEGRGGGPFRCLVNHDGVFDHRSMYYTTEELWFPEWEHGGPYYDNPEGHERHSPAQHVGRWATPMLVIHGGLDYRVPETQGLAAFTALQRRGVPSQLLWFPDEGHWTLKPANSRQWYETVLAWLERWSSFSGG